jgi:hypothetical protein
MDNTGLGMMIVLFLLYFIPSMVAVNRKHNNALAIFLTNLFFGWTILGWVIALIWASTNNRKELVVAKD